MLGLLPALPCLLLLSLPGFSSGSDDDGTVVLTTSGPIRGKRLPAGSSTVTAFLGIPYAEPPVGALRFQKPLPHQPWSHVLETTSFGNACHQPLLTGYPDAYMWTPKTPQSEDCLFLNVWVPHPRPPTPAPVLVWIHGGGFFVGAASLELQDGRFLAATENVIVASMNYRLGALGFLSLPPAAPGNAGLWDQRLALRWLRDNVAVFGGDPARLMLFGQSAGAASVGFHLLSPGSRPLFTRAALQSGATTSPLAWFSPEMAKEIGRALGRDLGCTDFNDTALVGCLQGKELGDFGKRIMSMPGSVPTVDGDFLPDEPLRLLEAGHSQPIPLLAGVTANEGSYLIITALNFTRVNASHVSWEELLEVLRVTMPGLPWEGVQAAAERYNQKGQGSAWYHRTMAHIISDYHVVCPIAKTAGQMAEAGSPVYAYTFTHRPSGLSSPKWMGVPHGSEVPYLFGTLASVGGANHTHTEAEVALSRRVMRYWAEFARSGNPTGAGGSGEQWPRYNATEKNFFRIGTEPPQVEGTSPARLCGVLTPLVPNYQRLKAQPKGTAEPAGETERLED
ncbi:acetylcholinesterase-like [Trachemys scripta elegans]|uniref:acetylcholinesterase-like n=1 Tax=Trachemys scripta elegans TaxID=31138 RepID=UPI00155300D7|nr:acetylcholinesterase-like [Trachemys scripta elegans]XP_034613468.1 acetylcholinesterase-like [Trachemys scripta elegans]